MNERESTMVGCFIFSAGNTPHVTTLTLSFSTFEIISSDRFTA